MTDNNNNNNNNNSIITLLTTLYRSTYGSKNQLITIQCLDSIKTVVNVITLTSSNNNQDNLFNSIADYINQQLANNNSTGKEKSSTTPIDYQFILYLLLVLVSLETNDSTSSSSSSSFILKVLNHFILNDNRVVVRKGGKQQQQQNQQQQDEDHSLIVCKAVVSILKGDSKDLLTSVLELLNNTSKEAVKYVYKILYLVLPNCSDSFISVVFPTLLDNIKQTANSTIRTYSLQCVSIILNRKNQQQQNNKSNNNQLLPLLYTAISSQSSVNERLKLIFKFNTQFLSNNNNNGNNENESSSSSSTFNILAEESFWNVVVVSLVDSDNVPRKQALHILKAALSLPVQRWSDYLPPWDNTQWNIFISLFECFNETKSHLFKPVWAKLPSLLPQPQNNNNNNNHVIDPTKSNSQLYWCDVLFRRGFTHINPNIRRRVVVDILANPIIVDLVGREKSWDLLHRLYRAIDLVDLSTLTTYGGKELNEALTNFYKSVIEQSSIDSIKSKLVIDILHYINTQHVQTPSTLLLLLSKVIEVIKLGVVGKDNVTVGDTLVESLRMILEQRPVSNSAINIHIYKSVLELLLATNSSSIAAKTKTVSIAQLSKLLAMYPRPLLKEEQLNVKKWLNNEWIVQYLIDNLSTTLATDTNRSFEAEQMDYASQSCLLLFADSLEKYLFYYHILSFSSSSTSSSLVMIKKLSLIYYISLDNPTILSIIPLLQSPMSSLDRSGIIKALMDIPESWPFRAPFDYKRFGLLDYPLIIRRPMDLGTIQKSLNDGVYNNNDQPSATLSFNDDCKLVFTNQIIFNPPFSRESKQAKIFLSILNILIDLQTNNQQQQTVNEIILQFIKEDNKEEEDNRQDNQIINQFKWVEMIIQLLASSNNSNKQSNQDILEYSQQVVLNYTSFDIRKLSMSIFILVKLGSNIEDQSILLDKLIDMTPKYKFNSTTSFLLPRLLQYRWEFILQLLQLSSSNSVVNHQSKNEKIFTNAIELLDIAASPSLPAIFDCLALVASTTNEILHDTDKMTQLFKNVYQAFSDSNKTNQLVLSFINVLFNQIYFHQPTIIPLLKEYLKKTLDQWGESNRISCGLLGHCCAIWSTYLDTIDQFKQEIIDLCLLSQEDNNQTIQEDQSSTSSTLKITSNHGYIVRWFVSQLNNHSDKDPRAVLFVRSLMISMLEMNIQGELGHREYSQQSRTNKMKCKLWRTLCSLTHVIGVFDDTEHTKRVHELMWKILEIKNHPNVRYLIQLFIINVMVLSQSTQTSVDLLINHLANVNTDYQMSASVVIISTSYLYYLLRQFNNNGEKKDNPIDQVLITKLFKSIVPWATDFHHAVRTCAQLAIHTILSRYPNPLLSTLSGEDSQIIQSIYNYLDNSNLHKRLREKQSLFIQNDDPLKNALASNIFSTNKNTNLVVDNDDDENNQDDNNNNNNDGDQEEDAELTQGLSAIDESVVPMSLLDIAKRVIKDFQSSFQNRGSNQQSSSAAAGGEGEDFQKRIIPELMSIEDNSNIIGGENNNNNTVNTNKNQRQEMIVVATFVENTPNIAGLIRTCEIFNVTEVAIPNLKLLNDPQFQRVSVSADKWVPIVQVARTNLQAYLIRKKEEGYAIIGVEQTSQSKSLSTFVFPTKCLLLLGQEQNGIPSDFLNLVDYCVEIPQFGIIRSLNVHVSGSIVLWEYSQQQILKSITNNENSDINNNNE
ncbi:tRNA/rRNA methyltransferase SpoU family protein [Cavenderia fasciculata]|uniref:tRNA (guanosine(18)-2'-O)-methyltransferase TARBP1 n=1 Tax=Cavenderia fasciculata TaxID=261658 RepID=F4QFS5_CACFS|nr:tRNA/rRNA methyltransferase SpoU family protein [Cavenderia fasciculata]EGG14322.1 tRNA/rRNA methyltransferase SpoU family protein [Cavenderia fasciculata]|eukprot:XP_004351031.1 tRNA/rRNA methyltransferase SpoU family protein [Cavenderia fasciculata]